MMIKSIELNDIQKNKLIKICTDLFPEYNFISYFESTGQIKLIPHRGEMQFIHWFELCITHLPEKIFNIAKKNYIVGELVFPGKHRKNMLRIIEEIHPVDYLYQELINLSEKKTDLIKYAN